MKKIFALVLAAAMLSTTAFAADVALGTTQVANPGDSVVLEFSDYEIASGASAGDAMDDVNYAFSADYLTITTKKITKGANLIKEVKFSTDANQLLIVLNDDYTLARPASDGSKAPNVVIEQLDLKVRKAFADGANKLVKGATYKLKDAVVKNLYIGYDVQTHVLGADDTLVNGAMVKFVDTAKNTPYATVSLNDAADIALECRVYDGDKVFVNVDNKAVKEVLMMSEDADLRFYNIKTNDFPSTATIMLSVEEDQFIYKIVDKKLVASGLKWSADDYAWTGKIRTSTSYVVSDVELKSAPAVDAPTTGNPETGANDVVGIAAALALVSLVAAGAVSMKK